MLKRRGPLDDLVLPPFCGDQRCDPCEATACPSDCRTAGGGGYVPPPLPEGNVGCGGDCTSFLDCGSALFCDASSTCAGFAAETCPAQQCPRRGVRARSS